MPPTRDCSVARSVSRVTLVALVLLLLCCDRARSTGAEVLPAANAGRAVPVATAVVMQRDVPIWLDGLGSVAAWQQITIRTQVDGRLDQVYFHEGQTVRRGKLLAQIDPRPFLVQLHQAEGQLARDRAQLEAAERNLERYRTLAQTQLVAPQQADDQAALVGQTQGVLQIDRAAVEAARLNLDYASIRSPIDGVLGIRLIDPGNFVRAADPNGIVVVTQLDPIAVVLTVPQDELGRIAEAQRRGPVAVEAWSRDGKVRLGQGTLMVVDNQINQATATLRLKARLPNTGQRLWPNQFVKARLLLGNQPGALVVPAAAIQRGPAGPFVYVVDAAQTAHPIPVTIARLTQDSALLSDGVEAGQQVVVEGHSQLRAGAKVRITAGPPGDNSPKDKGGDTHTQAPKSSKS